MTDQTSQRLIAMDVLRGIALLGILIMNIQSFSMPGSAYLNPTAYGNLEGANFIVWLGSHLFADQKFMSVFSMLFGAGVLLFCESAEKKGNPVRALHYRRTFWLLVFGLSHGYFLWYGDILFSYAMCGFIIYLFRKKSVKALLSAAFAFTFIGSAYSLFMGMSIPYIPEDGIKGLMDAWAPTQESLNKELAAVLGNYQQIFGFRLEETFFMQTYVFLTMFLWRATGMMLLGMAMFKSGFFHLKWSSSRYKKVAVLSFIVGILLTVNGVTQNLENAFSLQYSMFTGSQFNYWGSILVAVSYASLIMLWVKHGGLQKLQARFGAIGKTAFSNYILQTLICTTIFYGYGLGLFGEFERWQQLILVIAVWAVQFCLASFWLNKFAFGPLEWLWRSLTYWKLQPLQKQ